jgi:hypothetical protein
MNIDFIASSEEVYSDFPLPMTANKEIPNWYQEMPNYTNDFKLIATENTPNSTIKKCVPFRDALFAGYLLPLPYDIDIRHDGKNVSFTKAYQGSYEVIGKHTADQYFMYPIKPEYFSIVYKWNNPWIMKTPKGWSTMFITPSHRDVPFQVFTGIVDTDKYQQPVNLPFLLRKDFNGILYKGTPFVQCIPIKRKKHYAIVYEFQKNLFKKWRHTTTQAFDRYKDFFHVPKKYKIVDEKEIKCPFAKFFNK